MSWPVLVLSMAIAFSAGVMTDAVLPGAASCAGADAGLGAVAGDRASSETSAGHVRLAERPADSLDELLDPVDPALPAAPRSAR